MPVPKMIDFIQMMDFTGVDLTGFDHDGLHPPAGPRLFAFAAAIRDVNRGILQALEERLRGMDLLTTTAATTGKDDSSGSVTVKLLPDFEDRVSTCSLGIAGFVLEDDGP